MSCTLLSKNTKTVSRGNNRVDDDGKQTGAWGQHRLFRGFETPTGEEGERSLSSALKSNARSIAWEESGV
jgi:hypothetical protein